MPSIADYRNKFPSLRDLGDEALITRVSEVQGVTRDDVMAHMGYNPSDFGRGLKESFQQLPQLGYGLMAGAGAAGEAAFGEGGLMTGVKKAGVKGFEAWGDKIEAGARESDSVIYSYDQAKEGNFGALVDWLQHGLGYTAGQGIQALASAGIGAVGGKMVLGTAAKDIAKGMVLKESARIGLTAEGKDLAQDELIKLATANVAGKIGAGVAVGGMAYGQEGGEIFGDLTASATAEGRTLNGAELAKAFGATLAAGSLEFIGDKLGLDLVMGKSKIGNKVMGLADGATGIGGKVARGAMAGAIAVPTEAGTEYFQTGLEEYGKGKEANILPFNQSPEAQNAALEGAALGALGGAAIGGVSGLTSSPRAQASEEQGKIAAQKLSTATNVEDMVAAANELAMAPLDDPTPVLGASGMRKPGAYTDRAEAAATIAEIRQLDPEQQQEALGLLTAAGNMEGPANVRRYAQNRLDELLLPVRQIPTGEVTEGAPLEDQAAELAQQYGDEQLAPAIIEAKTRFPAVPIAILAEGLAFRLRNDPNRTTWPGGTIPAGEASDLIPTGEATSLPGAIPVGEATEVIPTGEATDLTEPIPVGEATDTQILPTDLVTQDGMPYGTRAGAAVRATREGGGEVVEVPGGFVVRQQGATNEQVTPDVAAPAALPAALPVAPADAAGDNTGGGGADLRLRPEPAAQQPGSDAAAPPVAGPATNQPVPDAGGVAPAVTPPAAPAAPAAPWSGLDWDKATPSQRSDIYSEATGKAMYQRALADLSWEKLPESDRKAIMALKSQSPESLKARVDALREQAKQDADKRKAAEDAWNTLSPADRAARLKKVGYTDAKQIELISGFKWHELATGVRAKVDAEGVKAATPAQPPAAPPAEPPAAAPAAQPAPEGETAAPPTAAAPEPESPKAKRAPKSFRKSLMVTTPVLVEESGKFEPREVDADTAIKAIDEDIAELEAFKRCIGA